MNFVQFLILFLLNYYGLKGENSNLEVNHEYSTVQIPTIITKNVIQTKLEQNNLISDNQNSIESTESYNSIELSNIDLYKNEENKIQFNNNFSKSEVKFKNFTLDFFWDGKKFETINQTDLKAEPEVIKYINNSSDEIINLLPLEPESYSNVTISYEENLKRIAVNSKNTKNTKSEYQKKKQTSDVQNIIFPQIYSTYLDVVSFMPNSLESITNHIIIFSSIPSTSSTVISNCEICPMIFNDCYCRDNNINKFHIINTMKGCSSTYSLILNHVPSCVSSIPINATGLKIIADSTNNYINSINVNHSRIFNFIKVEISEIIYHNNSFDLLFETYITSKSFLIQLYPSLKLAYEKTIKTAYCEASINIRTEFEDINECKHNIHKCNDYEICINTFGNYLCVPKVDMVNNLNRRILRESKTIKMKSLAPSCKCINGYCIVVLGFDYCLIENQKNPKRTISVILIVISCIVLGLFMGINVYNSFRPIICIYKK